MKIFLCDLTYNTNRVAAESYPLNVAFIASYCIKKFGSKVDITLFKYHEDLEKAIDESAPDILGLSNYSWNSNLSREMFKIFTKKNPDGLRVFGGPNFPLDLPSQQKFFDDFPYFDIYVPEDGEVGFSNIVEKALCLNITEIKTKILQDPVEGCIIRHNDGKLLYSLAVPRIKKLDEIPSPYTSGLLDPFFNDDALVPMLQTNRGCPFTCTFCADGRDTVNRVNRFSTERIKSDVEYIASHVPKNIHTLFITDLNFGMLPGDLETSNTIASMKTKYDYPHRILATTGKNNKERIIKSVESLNGILSLSMSVQSLDENVLKNIQRSNISTDEMLGLMPTIKKSGLSTIAEVIVGLPGETYESNLETIRKLVNAKLDDILQYTCMILQGSEMGTPEQVSKWQFQTKYQILPEDFTTLSNGKRICEYGEYVVSSKDLSFDEYIELRMIALTLWLTNKGILYNSLLKLLRQQNVEVSQLFFQMVERRKNASKPIQDIFESFSKSTKNDMYDSPEEIFSKLENDEFYQKLLDEEIAHNVVRYYVAVVMATCMDEWTDYVLAVAHELLQENNKFDEELEIQFRDVANFCRGKGHNPLGKNRMETNPEFIFNYDIPKWLDDNYDKLSLDECVLRNNTKGIFKLSDEKFKVVEDNLNLFGTTFNGYYKGLKMLPQHVLYRDIHYEK
jgi:radical SAM superfamily enzyme YgiQ (UPF0313 family)